MVKLRTNSVLLVFIASAFLAMQWSTVHYHLGEHHSHDGSHHKHSVSAHSHQLENHHADAIDSAHEAEPLKVVELDPEYNLSFAKKQLDSSQAAILAIFSPPFFCEQEKVWLPLINVNRQSFTHYTSISVRAPPYLS